MFAIGGAIVFIIILCIIIVITYIARKNEDKKEQERARKQESLPQEIAQSIKTVLGVKTTLVDDIVEAYKRLKAQDEQECKNRKDTKT